jgi:hypothetical protein
LTSSYIHGGQIGTGAGISHEFFSFPLLIVIPPLLYIYLLPPHAVCNSRDKVAHYHTLTPYLGALSPIQHLAVVQIKVFLV